MRDVRRPLPTWAAAAVALAATGSIAYGVWLTLSPTAAPSAPPAPAAASGPEQAGARPGRAPVPAHGTGTWEAAAPADQRAPTEALCSGCDVVVVTVCSLRRDHTGPYQPGESYTPALDALVDGAFRMDSAWAASNFTLAGLTAVLTGRFGSSTGVIGWDKGLVADVPTLPEVLGYYGYRTGAFTTDAPSGFRPDYGLDRGFQRMTIIPPPRDNPDGRTSRGPIGPGGAAARPAAVWLAEQPKDQPLFLMFHTRTAHYPFVLEDDATDPTGVTHMLYAADKLAPSATQAMPGAAGGTAQRGVVQFAERDPVQVHVREAGAAGVAMWRQRYAEAVQRTDRDFAVLGDALRARGRLDRTLLVVLADHGESLDDHGELLHGDAYYDSVTHIPMLVRVPGLEGRPLPALVSQVDLLPTVLDAVGAVPPAGIDGASLVPLLRGEATSVRTTALIEGGVVWHDDGHARGAVIAPPWALLRQDQGCDGGDFREPSGPATCLYNLDDDPGQTVNLARQRPEVVQDLQLRWDKFRAAHATDGVSLTLDPALVEELHKTGYDFRPGPTP